MTQGPSRRELRARKQEVKVLKTQVEAESEAKDVAGKAIGKHGLAYITIIVVIGVGASVFLDQHAIAAVIGLVSAALTALIAMLSGIAEAEKQGENPEFDILRRLIERMDNDHMKVEVSGDRVIIEKGSNIVSTKIPANEEAQSEEI